MLRARAESAAGVYRRPPPEAAVVFVEKGHGCNSVRHGMCRSHALIKQCCGFAGFAIRIPSLALRACMGTPLHPSPQRKQGNTVRPQIPCRTGVPSMAFFTDSQSPCERRSKSSFIFPATTRASSCEREWYRGGSSSRPPFASLAVVIRTVCWSIFAPGMSRK